MISDPSVTASTLAGLTGWRTRREAVLRWVRPLAPFVMIVVAWMAYDGDPGPGRTGRGLAVAVALGGFAAGGLGVLVNFRRRGRSAAVSVALLLAAATALVWLQPSGEAGVAGIFLGLSLLVPLLRGHLSIPLIVGALVALAVGKAIATGSSITSALLNAIMISSFYGALLLSERLGQANELAERLLIELERSRAAQARAAGLAERQRLAREMHDVLAHSLSGLMLQLEGARMLVADNPADPRLAEIINHAHRLGKSGLDEARRAIGMLRDDELPGPERLPGLVAQFQQDREIPCRFTVSGEAYQLDSEARLALYRVAQEALTNITKHARPERVELHLAYAPSAARLTIEDFATTDGPVPPPDEGGGYGLTGMRERAELLGGTLTAETTPGGFRVRLEVPA